MSTVNSNGSPRNSARAAGPAPVTPQRRAAPAADTDHILAQIPSLEPAAVPKSIIKRFDGRVISQSLSMKMVFGVGGAMVFGAILPFLFGKGSHPPVPPVNELPAWSAHGGPTPATQNTAQTMAPAWTGSQAAQPPVVVQPQPVASLGHPPMPPRADEYRPSTMNGPSWPQQPGTPSPRDATQQTVNGRPNDPRGNQGWSGQQGSGYRPRAQQADNRNDPAAGYRNDQGSNYRNDQGANYQNNIGPSYRNDPGSAYRNDPGNGYRDNNSLAAPPVDRGVPANNPSGNRYDNSNYPPPSQGGQMMPPGNNGYPTNSEPGVAHFEGNITNPPGRTN